MKRLLLFISTLLALTAVADSTSWKIGSYATTSGSGVAWTTPLNGLIDDTTDTNSTLLSQTSQDLKITHFAMAEEIPYGSTINGFEFRMRAYHTNTVADIYDDSITILIGGTSTGSNKANGTEWPVFTGGSGSVTNKDYGGSSDLWGITSPTYAQVVANNFGIQIRAKETAGTSNAARVQVVFMKVHYTPPSTASTGWVLMQNASNDSDGDDSWTDVNNALTDSTANYATITLSFSDWSHSLLIRSPLISPAIPSGATIDSIEFRVKVSAPSTDMTWNNVQVIKNGTKTGSSVHASASSEILANIRQDYFGGDLFGQSWTYDEFDLDFGIALRVADNDNGSDSCRVYTIYCRINYTEAEAGEGMTVQQRTRGFFSYN